MNGYCPLCEKLGDYKKITAVQINFQEAVWLCESEKCPWPFGYEEFKFIPRDFKELSKKSATRVDTQKGKEVIPISTELSLYTPPVTPSGDGSSKDSVKSENSFLRSPQETSSKNSLSYGSKTVVCPKSPTGQKVSNSIRDVAKPVLRSIFDIDNSAVEPSKDGSESKMQRIESNTCDTRNLCLGKSDKLVSKNKTVKSAGSSNKSIKAVMPEIDVETPVEFDESSKVKKILVFKQKSPNTNQFTLQTIQNCKTEQTNVMSTFHEMPTQLENEKENTTNVVSKVIYKLIDEEDSITSNIDLNRSETRQDLQPEILLPSNVVENSFDLEKNFQTQINPDLIELTLSKSLKDSSKVCNESMDANDVTNISTNNFGFNNSMLDDMLAISSNVSQEIDDEWLNLF